VGPASKISPIVPSFSTSATRVSPAAPPTTIAPNFCAPDNLFNSAALDAPLIKFGLFKFAYAPVLLAFKAFSASFVATFAPAIAGTPIDTNASVILPAALSSATSSNGFILSKNFSTSVAVLVSNPKSIKTLSSILVE
jgi:hypothetical protein